MHVLTTPEYYRYWHAYINRFFVKSWSRSWTKCISFLWNWFSVILINKWADLWWNKTRRMNRVHQVNYFGWIESIQWMNSSSVIQKISGMCLDENLSGDSMATKKLGKNKWQARTSVRKQNFLHNSLCTLILNALLQLHFDYACTSCYPKLNMRVSKKKSNWDKTNSFIFTFI